MSNYFKSGFVNIIGRPNVGKSTLLNALMGEKLAIISHKAQTTRRRVFGIMTEKNHQIILSDTPGIINPVYKLQERMMTYVRCALEDADIILLMVALEDKNENPDIIQMVLETETPHIFIINKTDLKKGSQVVDKISYWKDFYPTLEIIAISALEKTHIDQLYSRILNLLPKHPPYFPKDEMTDKSERFICSEIIREKLLLNYHQEVPYSSEVVITNFFEDEKKPISVEAEILVERESQKGIIIGKKASAIKKVRISARKEMESFFKKKVNLQIYVKVEKNWRRDEKKLRKLGYY